MKVGDLVRYKLWPHIELRKTGMVGIIISAHTFSGGGDTWEEFKVLWDRERPQGNCPMREYPNELEVVSESR